MKILFFTYDLPYPLNSGGKIRAYYLLKSLAKRHQITLVSFYRQEKQRQYLPEINQYCSSVYLFWRRPPWSWPNLGRWFFSALPFASATYYSAAVKKTLIKLLADQNYDLAHFESFYPALYLPLVKKMGVKTVLGNENLEYLVYQRYAEQKSFPLRQLLKLEVKKMRLYEEDLWRQADVNLAISPLDAAVIKKTIQKTCPVIPHGVDFDSFKSFKLNQPGKTIIFIGTLIYQANADAVRYFLKEIYPEIKKQIPGIRFILVSWHQPAWLKSYLQDTTIRFFADEKTPAAKFLSQADILISPKRIAGGINIKILEAMAMGLPVVTTAIGIEGIEVLPGKEIIVADQALDFASQVINLLKDKKERLRLGAAGRNLVIKKYDWKNLAQKLEVVYQELVNVKKN